MNLPVQKRSGFTLIELMVAIVIVALLAGMTIVGTRVAIKTSKESVVKLQMEQLSMALDQYKNDIGEYPPDFTDSDAVMRHVKKRWPRSSYEISSAGFNAFCADVATASRDPSDPDNPNKRWDVSSFSPVAALVFWLGGLPDASGKPSGFGLSPTTPITSSGQREEPRFSFADGTILVARVVPEVGWVPGFDPRKDGAPIVYFLATGGDAAYAYCSGVDADDNPITKYCDVSDTLGIATPYAKSTGIWYEPERFQLIHPGLDGIFNENSILDDNSNATFIRIVDAKQNMSAADDDNIVSFGSGATLATEYEENK